MTGGDQTTLGAPGPQRPEPRPEAAPVGPARIGHYRIQGVIGRGGYGTVYRGVHRWLGVLGAIKVMHRPAGAHRAAFLREARRLARLRGHPHVAEVRDFGFYRETGGAALPYLVMDFVPGARTITEYADSNGLDLGERLRLFAMACDGVRHAHALRILHLDLKPENILVARDARAGQASARVIDFGIARASDPAWELEEHREISGTIAYMSPEQTDRGTALDTRSDVYSLGVVLYELLCHHLPYDVRGRSTQEAIKTIRLAPPDFEGRGPRALPETVRGLLSKALSKSPDERYRNAGDLLRALRLCLHGEPPEEAGAAVRAAYRIRREVSRRPVFTGAAVLAGAAAATQLVGAPMVYSWSDATAWFMDMAALLSPPSLQHVAVVARTAESDRAGNLDPADEKSVRGHYAAMLRGLARAGARAVVFDVVFAGSSPHDGALCEAILALRSQGIPVVVGTVPGEVDGSGYPPDALLSRPIAVAATRFGDVSLITEPVWMVELVRLRAGPDAWESLAIAGVAAALEPDRRPHYRLEEDHDRVAVEFFGAPREAGGRRVADAARTRQFRVLGVREEPSEPARQQPDGRRAADTVANLAVRLPAASAFQSATVGMERLMGSSPDEAALRLCSGRVVVVHNPNPEDVHPHASGPRPGVHGHASAIEGLLGAAALRMPTRMGELAIVLAGAALGLALPRPLTRRRAWWPAWAAWAAGAAWVIAIAVVLGAGIVGAVALQYVVNPLVVVFAMVAGAGLSLAAGWVGALPRHALEAS